MSYNQAMQWVEMEMCDESTEEIMVGLGDNTLDMSQLEDISFTSDPATRWGCSLASEPI